MNVSAARRWITGILRDAGVSSPGLEACLMISEASDLSRSAVAADPDTPLGRETVSRLADMVRRRAEGEPLQYIFGSWEFYGRPLSVAPNVLIPRPETERLVEKALELLPEEGIFLDWGTGTGCITMALLGERPGLSAVAADANPAAVRLAWKNLNASGLLSRCFLWHSRTPADIPVPRDGFHMIVSNPPYIPTARIPSLMREVLHEPLSALVGGPDGLLWYRKLFVSGPEHLRPGGWMLFEIGDGPQGEQLREIAPSSLEFKGIFHDLSDKPRVAAWIRV